MASIRKEILLGADPETVWAALRDWPRLHERLVTGFVVGTRLDGRDRIVTFSGGAVARERLVTCDDDARRLVWAVTESGLGLEHHNAAAQVIEEPDGRTRFVWIADLLPDGLAAVVASLMDEGLAAVARTLNGPPSVTGGPGARA